MIIEKKNWHKTITSQFPEEFDKKINYIIQDPIVKSYKLTYRGDGLTACIEYTTEETTFENIKEEFEARGEVYYCDECPYIKPIEDHRHRYQLKNCQLTKNTGKIGASYSSFLLSHYIID